MYLAAFYHWNPSESRTHGPKCGTELYEIRSFALCVFFVTMFLISTVVRGFPDFDVRCH